MRSCPAALLAAPIAAALLFALPAAAAPTTTTVKVDPRRTYTPTEVTVHKGDTVAITASGTVAFGKGPIAHLGPDGIPWGRRCTAIANPVRRQNPWPASGVSCWSLIARIGTGGPIAIGKAATFKAANPGRLLLGVNDNLVEDNAGSFTAQVTVTPAGSGPVTGPSGGRGGGTTPGGTKAGSTSSGSSNTGLFVVIGAVVLLAIGLLLFLLRRRRGTDDDDSEATAPPPAPVVAPVAVAPVPAPMPLPEPVPEPVPVPEAPGIAIAPPDPESIDVNIFEVEFVNGLQLRIGYNHFPDGTPINWRVTQSRKPVSVGSFTAVGGGSTNHFETAALGIKLEGRDTHPDGADVQFDWNINGVPFRYSVRRDPNC